MTKKIIIINNIKISVSLRRQIHDNFKLRIFSRRVFDSSVIFFPAEPFNNSPDDGYYGR